MLYCPLYKSNFFYFAHMLFILVVYVLSNKLKVPAISISTLMSDPSEDIGCHAGLEQDPALENNQYDLNYRIFREENKVHCIAQEHEFHFFLSSLAAVSRSEGQADENNILMS